MSSRAAHAGARSATLALTAVGAAIGFLSFEVWWIRLWAFLFAAVVGPLLALLLGEALVPIRRWLAHRRDLARYGATAFADARPGGEALARGRVRVIEPVTSPLDARPCAAYFAPHGSAGGVMEIDDGRARVPVEAGEWEVSSSSGASGGQTIADGDEVIVLGRVEDRLVPGAGGGYRDGAPTRRVLTPPGRIIAVEASVALDPDILRVRRPSALFVWSFAVAGGVSALYGLAVIAADAAAPPARVEQPAPRREAGRGEPCGDDRRCGFDLVCASVEAAEPATCLPSCRGDDDCPTGQVCGGGPFDRICTRPSTRGEPCETRACGPGLVCRNNILTVGAENARRLCEVACLTDSECTMGEVCRTFGLPRGEPGHCQPPEQIPEAIRLMMELERDGVIPEPSR